MSLINAINNVRSGIIQLIFMATFSPEQMKKIGRPFLSQTLGSGFFINSEAYIITARHVIQEGRIILEQFDANDKRIHIGIGLPNSERFTGNCVLVDFDIIDENVSHDLCLLKLRKNPFKNEIGSGIIINGSAIPIPAISLRLNSTRPQEGQKIGISGYPLQERVLVTNSGHIASVWQDPYYLADIEVNPGNSGGPAYLIEDVSVIGVCTAYKGAPIKNQDNKNVNINGQELYYSSGLTKIIQSKYIIQLLEKNNVHYTI